MAGDSKENRAPSDSTGRTGPNGPIRPRHHHHHANAVPSSISKPSRKSGHSNSNSAGHLRTKCRNCSVEFDDGKTPGIASVGALSKGLRSCFLGEVGFTEGSEQS